MIAPDGTVMWNATLETPIAAAGSVDVSWFPGAELDQSSTTSSSGTIESVTSPTGTLTVTAPTGPFTNVDMPLTGVSAGSYGDGSHSAEITVDAEGRITSATSVAISGGSGTIGFEIGYSQKTSATFITSSNPASPTTIISPGAITFDGAPVLVTFYSPDIQTPALNGGATQVYLYEGSTAIARLTYLQTNSGTAIIASQTGEYRFTPTAGSHTYTIAGIANQTGSPFVDGGAGGSNGPSPCFVRFTKV